MGKRSNFKRRKNDAYDTPYKAVLPLIPHLVPESSYAEPCAGKGELINHLAGFGYECKFSCDIKPRNNDIIQCDALHIYQPLFEGRNIDYIITNPPWTRQLLHPMIEVFRNIATTWLLLDADWMHTKQASPYMDYCSLIVSIGRVSWEENGVSGKDNCCWYRFGKDKAETIFKAR